MVGGRGVFSSSFFGCGRGKGENCVGERGFGGAERGEWKYELREFHSSIALPPLNHVLTKKTDPTLPPHSSQAPATTKSPSRPAPQPGSASPMSPLPSTPPPPTRPYSSSWAPCAPSTSPSPPSVAASGAPPPFLRWAMTPRVNCWVSWAWGGSGGS